jgi:hypothetical protein
MDGKYSRALTVGLIFGVLLTCCNMLAYLWYQKQMDDYWASEKSRYVDNLCVGVDTYFYLIVLTAIVYVVGGIASVAYAGNYLEDRAHAGRAASLAGLMAAVISVPATILLILSGIFSTGVSYSGWALIYGMYAIGGICAAMIAGVLYYESRHDKFRTGPS